MTLLYFVRRLSLYVGCTCIHPSILRVLRGQMVASELGTFHRNKGEGFLRRTFSAISKRLHIGFEWNDLSQVRGFLNLVFLFVMVVAYVSVRRRWDKRGMRRRRDSAWGGAPFPPGKLKVSSFFN